MKAAAKAWIVNPWADIACFIATPLVIVPAYHALAALFSLNALKVAILSLSATGHHLPGFIRAYSDPAIFRQFKYRLLVVPALFLLLAGWAAYQKLSILFFLLITWGTWHGAMQIHGFLRIYDAKSGFFSAWTARLDFWMCLGWFVQVVLWAPGKKMSVLSSYYLAGGPLFPTPWFRAFESLWLAATLAVTAAWAINLALSARGGYFHPQKFFCLLSSFAFWAWCMIAVDNLIVGLLLWEVFHDLQYNVFVWSYNRNRVARDLSQSRVERFLFQSDGKRIALYAACIIAYGCVGLFNRDLFNVYQNQGTYNGLIDQIGNVFAVSALLHFYLDGFIWKVRDGKVRQDLGVASPETGRKPPQARHWAFVALFFLVSLGLAASERLHWTSGQRGRLFASLTELVPASGFAHFMRASQLKAEGHLDSAAFHYERAMTLDTAYAFSHALVADLRLEAGDAPGALAHYEAARRHDPGDSLVLGNLANLYLSAGRHKEAGEAFRTLIGLDSLNASAHYGLAFSLLQLKQGLDAKPHLERSLALDSLQPKALNYLGMVEQALGNAARAHALYERSLALDSAYAQARENLLGLHQ